MARRGRGLGYAAAGKSDLRDHMTRVCGSHYWDRDTMRFFNSKLEAVYPSKDRKASCFVTSEKFDETTPRKYTVRKLVGCKVGDVGKFQAHSFLDDARDAAKACARRGGESLDGARRRRRR